MRGFSTISLANRAASVGIPASTISRIFFFELIQDWSARFAVCNLVRQKRSRALKVQTAIVRKSWVVTMCAL
jgi:hypothetical protein